MDLQQLWKEYVNIGFSVRQSKENGLVAWQPHKAMFSTAEYASIKIALRHEIIQFINSLVYTNMDPELNDVVFKINGVSVNNTIETDHFLIQHFRIPILVNFELSLVKFLQLAYNVGQFKACWRRRNTVKLFSSSMINISLINVDFCHSLIVHICL